MTLNHVRVQVTQEDIWAGKRESYTSCPIAKAIRRTTRKAPVEVTEVAVRVGNQGAALPAAATQFIARFDAGRSVKPFAFTLYLDSAP